MPAIIQFLGYDPQPAAKGWGARLVRHRTTLGMTQKEAARGLGVDQGTLARWEQGKREPAGALLARVKRFLVTGKESDARRVG
jgi:transcriptional regulator with XRE-family HTH domain